MVTNRSATRLIALASSLVVGILFQGCQSGGRSTDERRIEIRVPGPGERVDLDAFRAQFAGTYVGPPHVHSRRAICSQPGTTNCTAEVLIQAYGESKDIMPRKPPKNPRAIAKIYNLDKTDMTEMDGLLPSSKAEYVVYIDDDGSGNARWNLLEVPVGRYGSIRRKPQKNLTECPNVPGHPAPPYSDVDFSECGEHPLVDRRYTMAGFIPVGWAEPLLSKIVSHFKRSSIRVEPGEWMYCPSGCCT